MQESEVSGSHFCGGDATVGRGGLTDVSESVPIVAEGVGIRSTVTAAGERSAASRKPRFMPGVDVERVDHALPL